MANDAYTGTATGTDASGEWNRINFMVRQIMNGMATSCPVIVKAVNGGSVDVQPMVNQTDGAGKAVEHGTIHNLPVWRLQGGDCAIIIDPVVGDKGLAVFAHSDISSAKENKAVSNPGSRRKFDWSDGIYLGGLLNGEATQSVRVSGVGVEIDAPVVDVSSSFRVTNGATGSFPTPTGGTITVTNGIITDIR